MKWYNYHCMKRHAEALLLSQASLVDDVWRTLPSRTGSTAAFEASRGGDFLQAVYAEHLLVMNAALKTLGFDGLATEFVMEIQRNLRQNYIDCGFAAGPYRGDQVLNTNLAHIDGEIARICARRLGYGK
jgi:hypothetical protein